MPQHSHTRSPALFSVLLIALVCVSVAGLGGSLEGQAPEKPQAKEGKRPPLDRELQGFMRQKLSASNDILEGLCIEDLAQVAAAARKLHDMSHAEAWQVRNDPIYRQFSNEFRQTTDDLIKAAEGNNLDRALLKWMDATMGCVDCHRFVRGVRIAK